MRNIITLAAKEVRSSFVTPVAYVVIAGFLVLSGFFFFSLVQQFNSLLQQAALIPNVSPSLNEWVVVPFYQTLQIVLIFLVPILTMRALAEEKQRGTFELLATSPLSVSDMVLGKYFGVALVVLAMLLLSFIFPLVLITVTDPEVAPVFVGFLGIGLFALGMTAVSLAISAFTRSQAVAAVVGIILLLLLFVVDAPASKLPEPMAATLRYLSPGNQAEPLLKGVIEGSGVVYFLSLITVGLFFTARAIDAQRWR